MEPQTPTQNPPITPSAEPDAYLIPIQPKNNWWISIVLFIIGVFLGGVSLLAYQKYFAVKPAAVASPTPAATPDPTAGWKTYTESDLDFSFRYPTTWSVSRSPTSNLNIMITTDPKDEKGSIPMQITIEEANQYNDNVTFTTIQKAQEYYLKSLQNGVKVTTNITVGDKISSRITGKAAGPGPNEGAFLQYTFIQLDNKVLTVQLGKSDIQNIHDQILSTFIFTQ